MIEAAEQVCSDDGIDQDEVLDLLSHLVNKSLVVVDESASGERGYRLLETIRQYGRDRLFRSGEVVAMGAPFRILPGARPPCETAARSR